MSTHRHSNALTATTCTLRSVHSTRMHSLSTSALSLHLLIASMFICTCASRQVIHVSMIMLNGMGGWDPPLGTKGCAHTLTRPKSRAKREPQHAHVYAPPTCVAILVPRGNSLLLVESGHATMKIALPTLRLTFELACCSLKGAT